MFSEVYLVSNVSPIIAIKIQPKWDSIKRKNSTGHEEHLIPKQPVSIELMVDYSSLTLTESRAVVHYFPTCIKLQI